MKTFVTGGSGVVGRAVIQHLVAEGFEVVALARSPEAAETVSALGADAASGDLDDFGKLVESMRGAELVFHIAGLNALCLRDPTPLYRVNVDGTRTVLRAAAAARVRRVVHTSSAVTIGEPRGTFATEDTPHRGWFLSHYEHSKFDAEQVALGERLGVEVVAVNPSSVQGPGRATGTGRLFLAALQGKLPFVPNTRFSIVDIDDCARGHLLAATHGTPGQRYLLSGFTVTTREAFRLLETAASLPVKARRLPKPLLKMAGRAGDLLPGAQRPFCTEMARVIGFGHAYDGSRAVRELGLTYRPAEATIRRTVDWFRSEGLLPDSI